MSAEETQGRDRTVDARRLHAGLRLVQLETAQILRRRRVGRPADEGCERPHVANVVAARLLGEAATLMSSSLSVLLIVTFRPEFQPPWAGRGDPAGPAIRRAHRDAG